MRKLLLALAVLAPIALAQTAPPAPAKLEIMEVEATVPASPTIAPFIALGYQGEIAVPIQATDAEGKGLAGVAVEWTVRNTGKAPVYVVAKVDSGVRSGVRVTVAPGASQSVTSTTGDDGRSSITLNANEVTTAMVSAKAGAVVAKNLRGADHRVDWMK